MVENGLKNREKLAEIRLEGMGLRELLDYVYNSLVIEYEANDDIFQYDWEGYEVEDD